MVGKGTLSKHFLQGVVGECFLLEDQSLQFFYVFTPLNDECFGLELALLVDTVYLCVNLALSVF